MYCRRTSFLNCLRSSFIEFFKLNVLQDGGISRENKIIFIKKEKWKWIRMRMKMMMKMTKNIPSWKFNQNFLFKHYNMAKWFMSTKNMQHIVDMEEGRHKKIQYFLVNFLLHPKFYLINQLLVSTSLLNSVWIRKHLRFCDNYVRTCSFLC